MPMPGEEEIKKEEIKNKADREMSDEVDIQFGVYRDMQVAMLMEEDKVASDQEPLDRDEMRKEQFDQFVMKEGVNEQERKVPQMDGNNLENVQLREMAYFAENHGDSEKVDMEKRTDTFGLTKTSTINYDKYRHAKVKDEQTQKIQKEESDIIQPKITNKKVQEEYLEIEAEEKQEKPAEYVIV
jgi:hypothetical protein